MTVALRVAAGGAILCVAAFFAWNAFRKSIARDAPLARYGLICCTIPLLSAGALLLLVGFHTDGNVVLFIGIAPAIVLGCGFVARLRQQAHR